MLSLLLHFSVDVHCWLWSPTMEIWGLIWETFSVRGFETVPPPSGKYPSCCMCSFGADSPPVHDSPDASTSARHNAITWWLGQISCAGGRTPGSLLMGGEVDHGNRSTERRRATSFQMCYKIMVRALLLGVGREGNQGLQCKLPMYWLKILRARLLGEGEAAHPHPMLHCNEKNS